MHSVHDGDLAGELRPILTTLRIILVALASGALIFAAVAIVLRAADNAAPRAADLKIVTLMAMAWTPLALVASRLVPAFMTKTARARMIAAAPKTSGAPPVASSETDLLMGQYQINTIISAALLEGTAFLNLVAYITEGHPVSLGLGIGLALVILSTIPRSQRAVQWIEQQVRLIAEEKMLNSA